MRWIIALVCLAIFGVAAGGLYWINRPADEPAVLKVAAGPRGGDSHKLMSEIAEVVERHSETVRLRIFSSSNSSVNISRLHRGSVDLATVEASTPAYSSIEMLAHLFPDYYLLIARSNSGIRAIWQLGGTRIAIPEQGSSEVRSFWSIVDHYSVAPEGFKTFSVSREEAVERFIQGRVDALFMVASLRDPFVLSFFEEMRQRGIATNIVPVDQAEAMVLKRPFLHSGTIVRGAFDGSVPLPRQDTPTVTVDRILVARKGVDADLIHELMQTVYENRLDLLIRMPLSSSISGPRSADGAALALHEGAQRYYDRDKPSYLQENAEPLALMVTLLAMIISALVALRRAIKARAKNRADVYNIRLLEMGRQIRSTDDRKALATLEQELDDMLERVVQALDTDKVTEEGFQSFAFLWGSIRDQMKARTTELTADTATLR